MNDTRESRGRGSRPRPMTDRITVRLPAQLIERLRMEAQPSEVVRLALRDWFNH